MFANVCILSPSEVKINIFLSTESILSCVVQGFRNCIYRFILLLIDMDQIWNIQYSEFNCKSFSLFCDIAQFSIKTSNLSTLFRI